MAHILKIGFGILLTAIGLVAGKLLAGPGTAGEPEDMHVRHVGCACDGDPYAAAGAPCEAPPAALPPQTLKNLGVEIGPAAKAARFDRTHAVQAVVVDRPLNRRPVVAPFGGIVTSVHVKTGEIVGGGRTLVTVAREPIPRPKPELTASLLEPVTAEVHEATRTLRTAHSQLVVTRRELERIQPFVENRTIPRKTAIDLEYEVARHEQAAEIARAELRNHGLTKDEIATIESGGMPPDVVGLWQRTLQRNALWNGRGDAILELLPEAQRGLPWSVAAVGELAAAGLASQKLIAFLQEQEHARNHFAEVAGLLLQGTPLSTVETLTKSGALAAQMTITAPRQEFASQPPDWDVERIHVRPGQRVDAGSRLVTLYDARQMWLELEPVGQEIRFVREAITRGEPLSARPLVPGSGIELPTIELRGMVLQGEAAKRGAIAYALVDNVSLQCEDDRPCRSWQLRVGLRYLVEVPVERFDNVFVLSADAVTAQGPDRVVFIQEGDTFRAQAVHVLYMDDVRAVLADDGSVFSGDPLVLSGAFSLGLALNVSTSSNVVDHGHSHQ